MFSPSEPHISSITRSYLNLPDRAPKPRTSGITMAIDNGVPFNYFTDVVQSSSEFIDFMKFGWGTSVVSRNIDEKIAVLRREGVNFYFGGTLFEKYIVQDRFSDFQDMCRDYRCEYVEVSNGTIAMSDEEKSDYVAKLATEFHVISEVGSKDQLKSENMTSDKWIGYIKDDIEAGAQLVTLEARESGRGGFCLPTGELRFDLIEEILNSEIDENRLLIEAPSMDLQSYFVKRIGPNVNLANIAVSEIIGLETIRLGLRSETLLAFEPYAVRSYHEGV